MTNIILIAFNTIKEIQRHKLFYVLTAGVVFMIVGGFLLGPLSLSEQVRLSINFSLTTSHIGLVMFVIYFSSNLISREIEHKTIINLFVKPISRLQFIIGKFFGMLIIILIAVILLTGVIAVIHWFYDRPVQGILFVAMWGVYLETLILMSSAFFLSSFASSFFIFVCSFFVFIIGHSVNGAIFLMEKGAVTGLLKHIVSFTVSLFPNLERLNWRSHVLYQDSVLLSELLSVSAYSFLWIVLLLVLTSIFFERRSLA